MDVVRANDEGHTAVITPVSPALQQDRKPRKDKSGKRKEDRTVDVLKTIEHLPSAAEKFEVLRSKYSELAEECKKQQNLEKRLVIVQREKDQMQVEHTRTAIKLGKLEALCRELQKQNKAMKEESLLKLREEEEKRKEVSAKFNATMGEINALMQQNSESNSKLRDENLSIQTQFKGVCEQYELREQQVEKMGQQMKLESQLAEAKLAKARLELQAQNDIMERDKAILMAEVARCQAKCQDHEKTEATLRAQINVYFEKYDEFQTVLTKSNQVYAGFKSEMEKMSKKITRLEKETATWKQKWESTHNAFLALAAEKQIKDNEVAQQARKLTQLQKLCRTLQGERSAMIQQLSAAGVTPSKDIAESELAEESTKNTSSESSPSTPPPKSSLIDVEVQNVESVTKSEAISPCTEKLKESDKKPKKQVSDIETNGIEKQIDDSKSIESLPSLPSDTPPSGDDSKSIVEPRPSPPSEVTLTVREEVPELLTTKDEVIDATVDDTDQTSAGNIAQNVVSPLIENILENITDVTKVPIAQNGSSGSKDSDDTTGATVAVNDEIIVDTACTNDCAKAASDIEPRVPTQDAVQIVDTSTATSPANGLESKAAETKTPSPSISSPTVGAESSNAANTSAKPSAPKAAEKTPQSKKTPPAQPDQKKIKDGGRRRKK